MENGIRVLVAECIPPTDPVGRASTAAWGAIKDMGSEASTFGIVEVDSVDALRLAIAEDEFDFLVVSAHGFYDQRTKTAGLVCGGERLVDQELGNLPPVVIFSACNVWPQGMGPVSIASLMFRQGAIVVVGTLVPIDVVHNSILMGRLFANVEAAQVGELPGESLEAALHHTLASNAINDIVAGNQQFQKWAHERDVLREFMLDRSPGRLRAAHVYEDSEVVLLEVADELGDRDKVSAWLASPGYFPETVFYAVQGWPERILFRQPDNQVSTT